LAKSKPIKGAGIIAAPISPEMPGSENVVILLHSDNKEHTVSPQLAKTLINKGSATLKTK